MTHDPHNQTQRGPDAAGDSRPRDVHGSVLREKDEPHNAYEPLPLWLVSGFMALVLWAGVYLAYYSGGFQSTVFDAAQFARAAAPGAPVETKGPPDPMVLGKRVFTANCVACHQATGLGVPNAFPPLVGSEWVLRGDWHADNHLVSILLHGLQGQVQVKGATYNGAMPAWKQLKDEEIAAVLTYIRNEWGNSAPAITAEQVAKIRAETAAQAQAYTQAELQAMPAVNFEAASEPAAPDAVPGAPPEGAAPEASPAANPAL